MKNRKWNDVSAGIVNGGFQRLAEAWGVNAPQILESLYDPKYTEKVSRFMAENVTKGFWWDEENGIYRMVFQATGMKADQLLKHINQYVYAGDPWFRSDAKPTHKAYWGDDIICEPGEIIEVGLKVTENEVNTGNFLAIVDQLKKNGLSLEIVRADTIAAVCQRVNKEQDIADFGIKGSGLPTIYFWTNPKVKPSRSADPRKKDDRGYNGGIASLHKTMGTGLTNRELELSGSSRENCSGGHYEVKKHYSGWISGMVFELRKIRD
jgi:hypothetical protein